MKRIIPILLAAVATFACSPETEDEDRFLSFKEHSAVLEVGQTFQIDPLIYDCTAHYDFTADPWHIKFEISDPSVVSVSAGGLVTALAVGSSTIKLTGDGVTSYHDISITVLGKSRNIKVMSFNAKVDDRSGTSTGWDYRRDGAVAMIRENAPDLIGLQEGQAHEISYLAKNLPDYKWYGLGRDTGTVPPTTDSYSREESMAIFYNAKVLRMEDCGTLWLSETPDKISYGWDADYRRTFTWAKFTIIETGRTIFFFNTHLDNKGSTARKESIKLIVRKMASINPNGYPSFLTADFNSATTNAIFDPLKVVMKDARSTAPDTDTHHTFHNYESATGKSTIDHVWYAGTGNTVLKYHTVIEKYAGMQFVSDHYPVYGQFSVR